MELEIDTSSCMLNLWLVGWIWVGSERRIVTYAQDWCVSLTISSKRYLMQK